ENTLHLDGRPHGYAVVAHGFAWHPAKPRTSTGSIGWATWPRLKTRARLAANSHFRKSRGWACSKAAISTLVYAVGNALPNFDPVRMREAVWARPRTPPFCLIIALAHLREAPAVRGVSEPAAVACNAAEVRSAPKLSSPTPEENGSWRSSLAIDENV